MKTVSIGEFKTNISEVLRLVRNGEEITIVSGRKKGKVAVILPYDHYKPKDKRQLGLLKGKAGCVIKDDFKLIDEGMVCR
jgi:prevent-host-death family protein